MNKKSLFLLLLMLPAATWAAGGGAHIEHVDIDVTNKASLQRGAQLFANYCMGCHSLKYMTYRRMGEDLGLTEDQVTENLMFVWDGKKDINDYMNIAMPAQQAEGWFGVAPPDLSVVSRSRGADWLYSYLRSFYVDESKPFGVNNLVFKDVAMPHVLWELEGLKKAKFEEVGGHDGQGRTEFVGFEKISEGSMTDTEFDRAMRDLVAFLVYAGEPGQVAHKRLGVWVILFLLVFAAISYVLKKEYWRDVH